MKEKYEVCFKKLETIIKTKNIIDYKKETLLKLINIFNNTNIETFENIIIKNLKNSTLNIDIYISLLNSIISDFDTKYIKKISLKNATIYEYDEYINIFLKDNFNYKILEDEINTYNINEIQLHNISNKKKKIILKKDLEKELTEVNVNNYKIKIIKKI